MNETHEAPINQFHGFEHEPSYLPDDFWLAVLVFLPVCLLVAWLLHRRAPTTWVGLRSAISASVTVSLTYPIRYFFWVYDEREPDLYGGLSEFLFRPGDTISLLLLLSVLFAASFLFSFWLKTSTRVGEDP